MFRLKTLEKSENYCRGSYTHPHSSLGVHAPLAKQKNIGGLDLILRAWFSLITLINASLYPITFDYLRFKNILNPFCRYFFTFY